MLRTCSGKAIACKHELRQSTARSTAASRHNLSPFRSSSTTPIRQAQANAADKDNEEIQRILREYGVDPDEVGDKRLEEKRRKEEKKVEDYKAWAEWDGMVDRKDEPGSIPRAGPMQGDSEVETQPGRIHENNADKMPAQALDKSSISTKLVTPHPASPIHRLEEAKKPTIENHYQQVLNDQIHRLRSEADSLRKMLQLRTEQFRSKASEKAKELEFNARIQFGLLGGRMNELTGYDEVERLKQEVTQREEDIARFRSVAREAKQAYDEAVNTRTQSQRDVNSLLERKHAWTDSDVVQFTSLVRTDHSSNASLANTKTSLVEAEQQVEKAFDSLMKSILHRYHEEQVWSDKIRSVSTYGSLIVLLVNLIVFLGAIVVVEPWKRKRLVTGLEERVKGMMEMVESKVESEMVGVKQVLGTVQSTLAAIQSGDLPTLTHTPAHPLVLPNNEITDTTIPSAVVDSAPSMPHIQTTLIPTSIKISIAKHLSIVSQPLGSKLADVDAHTLDIAVIGSIAMLTGVVVASLATMLR